MRHLITVVFALVGFGSGIALAEDLKAPACESKLRGVMWDFGTSQAPDVRRCDGISYVPYGLQVAPSPTGTPAKTCEAECSTEARDCESNCGPSFLDTDCKSRCQRSQVQCKNRC